MRELVRKINDGRYKLSVTGERVKIETCLFLLECLQTIESHRITVGELGGHPLISEEMLEHNLHNIDNESFEREQGSKEMFSDFNSSQGSAMLSRFDDTEIMEEDVILTSKRSYQRELLIK